MRIFSQGLFYRASLVLLIFIIGFLLSNPVLLWDLGKHFLAEMRQEIWDYAQQTITKVMGYPNARHYFLLPEGGYLEFQKEGVSFKMALAILSNALFNSLFQPIFLCIFTPQAILNYILFPFFLYGAIRYFRKLPIMILFFIAFSLYIGIRASIVESLIRHRMSCELIYLLIGLAGFTDWIREGLS